MGCGTINHNFNIKEGYGVLDSFEFESGKVLENLKVQYQVSGIPKYDDEGNITNAIIYCPTLLAANAIMPTLHDNLKGFDFDKNEYFFIRIVSLGVPESFAPSTSGLKYNFPRYTFKDRVNFERQFLAENFKIKKIFGLVGEGVGGCKILTWASEYPDDMDFIILVNTPFKTCDYRYIFCRCSDGIIESSEDYYSDMYSVSLSRTVVAINKLLFAGYFSKNVMESLSNDELDVLMEGYIDDGLFMDIYDFKLRNDCIAEYDLENQLCNIKAKTLVLGISGYLFFSPEVDALPLDDLIKDSEVYVLDSKIRKYYEKEDFSQLADKIFPFLDQFR